MNSFKLKSIKGRKLVVSDFKIYIQKFKINSIGKLQKMKLTIV